MAEIEEARTEWEEKDGVEAGEFLWQLAEEEKAKARTVPHRVEISLRPNGA